MLRAEVAGAFAGTVWRLEDLWQSHQGRQPRVKLPVGVALRPPEHECITAHAERNSRGADDYGLRGVPREPSRAMRTSWLRVRTWVFWNNCCRQALTALSVTARRAAISLLASPSKTPCSTCCSRSVKSGPGLASSVCCTSSTMSWITFWSTHISPPITRRMALAREPGELCLRKMPEAPSFKAREDSFADMPAVTMRIFPV